MDDYNDYLDAVSPKYYRDFRLLYNELIGYIERGENDNIKAFEQRINGIAIDASDLYQSLHHRLSQLNRQKGAFNKQMLHQRFRDPEVTIPVTHDFPLPISTSDDDDVEQPTQTVADVGTVHSDPPVDVDEPSVIAKNNDDESLEKSREMDALLEKMAMYNHDRKKTKHDLSKGSKISVNESVSELKESMIDQISDTAPEPDIALDSGGVSLNQDFSDNELAIRSGDSNDELIEQPVDDDIESLQKSVDKQFKKEQLEEKNAPLDDSKKRRKNIWKYIEKDQSSVGIDHEF